jgi:uracil-DNA glycosylase
MDKKSLMEQIHNNVKSCKKCRLYQGAKQGVPGEGNIDTELAFVGEAPGAVEDETGRPFVGRAGKLLETLLKEIGYKREDVWIGNIIKHRPPGNRDPLPDEIKACEPYLEMQLKIIKPKLIVTLGRFAMNYFYSDGKITRDRGQLIKAGNYNIYPVYHPAAALRNGSMGEVLRKDFLRIPEILARIGSDPSLLTDSGGKDQERSKDQTLLDL